MATTMRRNTYVVGGAMPAITDISRTDRQNLMRLKVNRIALIQEIKVENIIPILREKGVFTSADKKKIFTGSACQDKTRILLDLLASKRKETEWYKHFRDSLMNPNGGTEVKKRYRLLIEFLDNTFLPRPTSSKISTSGKNAKIQTLKYPKYDLLPEISESKQNILDSNTGIDNRIQRQKVQNVLSVNNSMSENTDVNEDQGKGNNLTAESDDKLSLSTNSQDSMTLVTGYVHQWVPKPDSFTSGICIPEHLNNELEESNLPDDKEQLHVEQCVLKKIQKLEMISALKHEQQLPQGFEICMCEALVEILNEPQNYHLCVKYVKDIKSFATDIVQSFSSVLRTILSPKNNEATDQAISHGFQLCDFFLDLSLFSEAEEVITELTAFLTKDSNIDTWMPCYKTLVKLTEVRNRNYNFKGSEQAYFQAVQVTWKIQLMSFGKDLVEEGDLMLQMSHYQLEQGALSAGYGWAKRALQEFSHENHVGIVNALCNAVMAYCAKWQIKKAGDLALQAVRQARDYFGKCHPLYLKALLHLCHFTSEFIQEEVTLQIAKITLDLAVKMYGCPCLQVAFAHRAVSKALLVLQKFDSDEYYTHAMEAVRIVRGIFPNDHPILYVFLHTFSSALQWKALNSPPEVQDSTLHWAEVEAKQALNIAKSCYGDISLRTAQVYSLLGQIFAKMTSHPDITNDLFEEAEANLKICVRDMKLCQSPNSQYYLLSLATLGTFYKILHRPKEAVVLLTEALGNIENQGFYQKWIHECYEHLMACYKELGDVEAEQGIQHHLNTWLDQNPHNTQLVTLDSLNSPQQPFHQFLEAFDLWGTKMKKIKHQLTDAIQNHLND